MSPRTAPRLIGRERELGVVIDALTPDGRERAAVVTITGPVGVGKSALATRAAADLHHASVFGAVVRVDANATSPALSLREALDAEATRRDTVLVLVDGWDEVRDAPALLAALLAEDPAVTLLATSRSPLRTPGEVVVEVAPLATPQGDDPEGPALDCLVAQLPEGARAGLLAGDRSALAALLRELDGLPLAITLAAPRLALMDARTLLHRLHRSRSILDRPGAKPEDRRPFEAALASALQALSAPAQTAMAAIASFVGPATVAALEAVVGRASPNDPRALDVIAELRERSLLVASPAEGELRLGMLRCVREVVIRSASRTDLDAGRDRHATYFTERAEALLRATASGGGADVAGDRDDFVAVLERVVGATALSSPMVDRALRLLVAIYALPGAMPPAAFLPIIDAAVDRTKDSGADPALVAKALVVRARARRATGDAKGSTRDLLRALQVAAPARRRDVEAEALTELAHLLAERGELEAAVDHARRASIAWRDQGDRGREAAAAALVGDFERRRGDVSAAREAIARAIPLADLAAGGVTAGVVDAALRLHLETRDDQSLHHVIASVRAATPLADERGVTLLLCEAALLHDRGEIVAAREAYARAEEAARAAGSMDLAAETALFDGIAALALDRRGDALARFRIADRDSTGVIASDVAGIARALGFALDAWLTPVWRGARPPPSRSRLARALVDGAEAGNSFGALRETLAADGDDRVLFRLLDHALGKNVSPRETHDPDVARFDVDGRWFRLPAEPIVNLERRRPLAAMLKLLVAERLARPGTSVTTTRLLAAGWPGERVQADAGAHRVRVALSTLRKLGLRTVLTTTADGYALDPARKLTTAVEATG